MLIRLVYSSSAASGLTRDGLVSLLIHARNYNLTHQLTGLLLYKNGEFLQVLEGEESHVHDLYFNKITHDRRHCNSLVLFEEPIEERLFTQWSMGFRSLNEKSVLSLPGFDLAIDQRELSCYRRDPSGCMSLFSLFAQQKNASDEALKYFP